jgi:HEAT repeat protein
MVPLRTLALLIPLLLSPPDDLASLKKKFQEDKLRRTEDRKATILALGRLRTPPAAEFLIGAFDQEGSSEILETMIHALGECGTDNAVRHLLKVAEDQQTTYELRGEALDAAVRSNSDAAFDVSLKLLANVEEADWLRLRAGRSVLKFGRLDKTQAAWRKVLKDKFARLRVQALYALAPLKDPEVLAVARSALFDTKVPELRRAAVDAWKWKGGPEAAELLLKVQIRGDNDLRTALLDALSSFTDDASMGTLGEQVSEASIEVRGLVATALGRSSHSRSFALLEKLAADENSEVRFAALDAMAERNSDAAGAFLRAAAAKGEDETAEAAVALLPRFPNGETTSLLIRLAGEAKRAGYRMTVLDSLSKLGADEAFPIFKVGLEAKEWPVRAISIRGLGRIKKIDSIDLLIGRLDGEEGRLLGDSLASLRTLTGKALGINPEHWKAWWQTKRSSFSFERILEEDGGEKATTTYHGIPVFSRRIAFLVDVSGSMLERHGDQSRLHAAKEELIKVLKALDKSTRVNLIFFSDRPQAWRFRLAEVGGNLKRAIEAVENVKADGDTNVFDSLEKALEDPDVDTIYLLSDGVPTTGKYVSVPDVLRAVRRLNRARQILIHAVSIGSSPFMQQLAGENGGQYQEIR